MGDTASIESGKIASALAHVRGKKVDSVFLRVVQERRFQIYITFVDDTHYEFYGTGDVNGTSSIKGGGTLAIRGQLRRDAKPFTEIPPFVPEQLEMLPADDTEEFNAKFWDGYAHAIVGSGSYALRGEEENQIRVIIAWMRHGWKHGAPWQETYASIYKSWKQHRPHLPTPAEMKRLVEIDNEIIRE